MKSLEKIEQACVASGGRVRVGVTIKSGSRTVSRAAVIASRSTRVVQAAGRIITNATHDAADCQNPFKIEV